MRNHCFDVVVFLTHFNDLWCHGEFVLFSLRMFPMISFRFDDANSLLTSNRSSEGSICEAKLIDAFICADVHIHQREICWISSTWAVDPPPPWCPWALHLLHCLQLRSALGTLPSIIHQSPIQSNRSCLHYLWVLFWLPELYAFYPSIEYMTI